MAARVHGDPILGAVRGGTRPGASVLGDPGPSRETSKFPLEWMTSRQHQRSLGNWGSLTKAVEPLIPLRSTQPHLGPGGEPCLNPEPAAPWNPARSLRWRSASSCIPTRELALCIEQQSSLLGARRTPSPLLVRISGVSCPQGRPSGPRRPAFVLLPSCSVCKVFSEIAITLYMSLSRM